MNGDCYIGVLGDHLLDMMSTFMQGGGLYLTAKKVIKWLADKNKDVKEWPGNSSDLNHIENV